MSHERRLHRSVTTVSLRLDAALAEFQRHGYSEELRTEALALCAHVTAIRLAAQCLPVPDYWDRAWELFEQLRGCVETPDWDPDEWSPSLLRLLAACSLTLKLISDVLIKSATQTDSPDSES